VHSVFKQTNSKTEYELFYARIKETTVIGEVKSTVQRTTELIQLEKYISWQL